MQKPALATLAALLLAGCSSNNSDGHVDIYNYDSQAHTGNVLVTDVKVSGAAICSTDWRDGEVHQPSGIYGHTKSELALSMTITTSATGDEEQVIKLDVPKTLGNKVLAKDYQSWKAYVTSPDANGVVVQGDYLEYPDGYYVRVSNPGIKGNTYMACVGIDHMYVLESDLKAGGKPQIYLDRITIPLSMDDSDDAVKVSYGNEITHHVELRVRQK